MSFIIPAVILNYISEYFKKLLTIKGTELKLNELAFNVKAKDALRNDMGEHYTRI